MYSLGFQFSSPNFGKLMMINVNLLIIINLLVRFNFIIASSTWRLAQPQVKLEKVITQAYPDNV